MKKILFILLTLIALGLVGGSLYYVLAQIDTAETVTMEIADSNPFPYAMPDVVMNPLPGMPLY